MKGMEGRPKPDHVKVIFTGGVVAIIRSLKGKTPPVMDVIKELECYIMTRGENCDIGKVVNGGFPIFTFFSG